uniref:TSA: Wollemia nobilis Ref_Wollemi_Transcript_14423_2311 transcribed RNA sequence n=1 Tax=Wollemia nobilis TaxID=56998 RepID=A0A0C9RJM9_9CONI
MRNFSLTNKDRILSEAWGASCQAYKCKAPFYVKYARRHDVVFIAFPGSNEVRDLTAEGKFGECKINEGNDYFPSFKSTATDEPAVVHKPILKRFLFLLTNTEFQNKVYELGKNRTIVFTGHSVGGSVAALATVWLLEKRADSYSDNPPICITFGSPLLGDDKFGQAIRRERWAAQFYHVISRFDIVPRILLAPFKSISEPLHALLPYWWRSMTSGVADYASLLSELTAIPGSLDLVGSVMQHASAVASYRNAMCMTPNNMLLSGICSVVKLSPYRPFGFYVLGSANGVICLENYEAVLQILYYTLQSSDPSLIVEACIAEHVQYGSMLDFLQNLMDVDVVDAQSAYDHMAVMKQLEALSIDSQNVEARLALQAAAEVMNRLRSNCVKKKAELSNMRGAMDQLEVYKKSSKVTGIGYYDCFKLHKEKKDFDANLARLRLAGFWDEIKDMVDRKELPDDFETEEEWIKAGSVYRMLVEPLDIANYYRLGKHEDSGHYLAKGRPRRYILVEKWLEAHQVRRDKGSPIHMNGNGNGNLSLTSDSCLWAYLEEISYTMAKTGVLAGHELSSELSSDLDSFEKRVRNLIEKKELAEDKLLEESSFVKWWKMLPSFLKSRSLLWEFMEGGGRRTYCGMNTA